MSRGHAKITIVGKSLNEIKCIVEIEIVSTKVSYRLSYRICSFKGSSGKVLTSD
jgi:hypothetical protein